MHHPSALLLTPLLLLPQTLAFIVGPTIKSAVTVAKCKDTTGTMFVPATNKHIDFTFNAVSGYPCVLNDVNSKGAARDAPGDDKSPDFTVGTDIEHEVGHQNCLAVTGTIDIPGVGSAGVTFKHVDKYACMFSIVGGVEKGADVKGADVKAESVDHHGEGGGNSTAAIPPRTTFSTAIKAESTSVDEAHKTKSSHDDEDEDDSCASD